MSRPELTLLVPGLLAADTMGEPREVLGGLALDALERLLGKADIVPRATAGLEGVLFELFGIGFEPRDGPPVAPLTLWHDSGQPPQGVWLRADPVAVRPTQDRLIMEGGGALALEAEEAGALCAELNGHFTSEGWQLICPVPGRWYIRLESRPQACFIPLPEVIGTDIHPGLPSGPDGRYWRSVLNEAQMILHASEVNRRRAADGRPEVNSLWFWGPGALPAAPSADRTPDWSRVWADVPLAGGLAMQAGVPFGPRPGDAADWLAEARDGGRHLVLLDELREPARLCAVERWRDGVGRLHRDWFEPLHDALGKKRLDALDICPVRAPAGRRAGPEAGHGVSPQAAVDYHITPRLLRRWRPRRRRLMDLCGGAPRS